MRLELRGVALLCLGLLLGACRGVETGSVQAKPPLQLPRPAPLAQQLRARLELAEGYFDAGDLERARISVERALELGSRSWEAHNLFGRIYQRQGDADLAEKHFRLALRTGSGDSRVHNDYGVFLYQQERYKDAIRQLRRAVANPGGGNRSIVYENLGHACLAAGDRQAARDAFERAVRLEPRLLALLELAELAYDDADNASGSRWYQAYRDHASSQTPRSLWLGIRLARAVNDVNAEASYALQLRNLYPYSDELQNYLALPP